MPQTSIYIAFQFDLINKSLNGIPKETLDHETNNLIFWREDLKAALFHFLFTSSIQKLQRKQNMQIYLMIAQDSHIPNDIYHLKTPIKDLAFQIQINALQFLKFWRHLNELKYFQELWLDYASKNHTFFYLLILTWNEKKYYGRAMILILSSPCWLVSPLWTIIYFPNPHI